MKELPRRYWVPWLRGNIPDWTRAVPEDHPRPELRPGDVALQLAVNVPADVRAKWENEPPQPDKT